ncbi:MAG: DUF4255 domain-containing protein [Roseiflexaceae bacterium]|nr:DUF4255 domain-containing protein [Roseiflexaceae bacterium]
MISELDETIRQLLLHEGSFDPSQVDISFDIPDREWSSSIAKPTMNCYLFDIRENREMRQHGMHMENAKTAHAYRQRPLAYYDLTYLVTAWTRAVEDEHRLIWHTLQTLTRFDQLPPKHLQGALNESSVPIYARAALPESVLKSPGEFWTALENQLKPSLSYVITLAMERPKYPAGPPVLTSHVAFRSGGVLEARWVWLGGSVSDSSGAPVGGAEVEVAGRGLRATADAEGRFRLRVPGPGRYTLVAQAGTWSQRREIDIPDTRYDIAFDADGDTR